MYYNAIYYFFCSFTLRGDQGSAFPQLAFFLFISALFLGSRHLISFSKNTLTWPHLRMKKQWIYKKIAHRLDIIKCLVNLELYEIQIHLHKRVGLIWHIEVKNRIWKGSVPMAQGQNTIVSRGVYCMCSMYCMAQRILNIRVRYNLNFGLGISQ